MTSNTVASSEKILLAMTFGLFIFFLAACDNKQEQSPSNEKPTIKIGAILPLTGNLAHNRTTTQEALLLALKDNENNTNKYNYEIMFEDYAGMPSKAISAYHKLRDYDTVDVVISSMSFASAPIAPLAEKDKIPHLTISFGDRIAKNNDYTVNFYTPLQEMARHFAQTLSDKGIKNVGIIYQNIPGYVDLLEQVRNEFLKQKINIVLVEGVNPQEKDFKVLVSKIKSTKMDIMAILLLSPELEIFYKQYMQQGISTPVTSINAFAAAENTQMFNGSWFTMAMISTTKFADYFKMKTGHNIQDQTASAYDMINIIIKAYEQNNAKTIPEGEDILRELMHIKNWNGASGMFSINKDGTLDAKAQLAIIRNGKPVVVEEE